MRRRQIFWWEIAAAAVGAHMRSDEFFFVWVCDKNNFEKYHASKKG
jgi:hypothetical protein